jgi:integrase
MMKGKIRPTSRQRRCAKCGQGFIEIPRHGYICKDCGTTPNRFLIDLYWNGQRCSVCSDKAGMALDTYQRTYKLLSHIQTEIDNHIFDPTKYVKSEQKEFYVNALLDRFLQHKIGSIAPSYKKDYTRMVNMAKDFFKVKDVRELRKIDITNYKEHLAKEFTFSNKTMKNTLDLFKTFLNYVKNEFEYIDNVPPFPEIDVSEHKFQWVSQENQSMLFSLVQDHHKSIIGFLMLHGCRPSEARALRCKDVNLDNQSITISATFSGRVYREKRKGKRSKSVTIPIHPEMTDFIASVVKNNLPEAYIFTNRQGRYYSENALRRIWDSVRRKAKLDKSLRLYDVTRHSFASNLVNSGTSIFKVSKLLGHSSTKMSEKYIHTEVENLRADLNKLSLYGEQTVNSTIVDIKISNNIR